MNTVEITPAVPNRMEAIRTPKGVQSGTRYFVGNMTATEAKAAGKKLGHTGNKLKKFVSEALSSDVAQRKCAAFCAIEAAHTVHGLIPDVIEIRKNTGVIKLVKAVDENADKSKEIAEKDAQIAEKDAEIARLTAQVAAEKAAREAAEKAKQDMDTLLDQEINA